MWREQLKESVAAADTSQLTKTQSLIVVCHLCFPTGNAMQAYTATKCAHVASCHHAEPPAARRSELLAQTDMKRLKVDLRVT